VTGPAGHAGAAPSSHADGTGTPAAGEAGTAGATAVATPGITVTPGEFFRADIRVGVIVRAEEFPQARNPAYKLWIDFGELGTRTSSAQLTTLYQAAGLTGRLVLAVVNFPPRRVAGFPSQVLVLGVPAPDAKHVALVAPDRAVPPGTRVF
jgi:tRNA-binding protein